MANFLREEEMQSRRRNIWKCRSWSSTSQMSCLGSELQTILARLHHWIRRKWENIYNPKGKSCKRRTVWLLRKGQRPMLIDQICLIPKMLRSINISIVSRRSKRNRTTILSPVLRQGKSGSWFAHRVRLFARGTKSIMLPTGNNEASTLSSRGTQGSSPSVDISQDSA